MGSSLAEVLKKDAAMANPESPAILVEHLDFGYDEHSGVKVLHDINFSIPRGARVLLVGSNGAGKSTLLRLLGGLHSCVPPSRVLVLGRDSFSDTSLNRLRQHMDPNWGVQTVAFAGAGMAYACDMEVGSMMSFLQKEFPERRDRLAKLLGISLKWKWNCLSDGQRRRVQLFLGLLVPFQVVLLDEVTALLDLLARNDLLQFLKEETETRNCTVVIATHVFDGLDNWATHALWLRSFPLPGSIGFFGPITELPGFRDAAAGQQSRGQVLALVEMWLRTEQKERNDALATQQEEEGGEAAHYMNNPLTRASLSAGGYAPGRSSQISERSLNYDAVLATR